MHDAEVDYYLSFEQVSDEIAILIQIYIIKIQTILNGRIVKENYWLKIFTY